MSKWSYDTSTFSYSLRVENGVYFVAQSDDGSWRAYFEPNGLGRYTTDGEAMRAVEDHLARRF